jgi:hypothetical protein
MTLYFPLRLIAFLPREFLDAKVDLEFGLTLHTYSGENIVQAILSHGNASRDGRRVNASICIGANSCTIIREKYTATSEIDTTAECVCGLRTDARRW